MNKLLHFFFMAFVLIHFQCKCNLVLSGLKVRFISVKSGLVLDAPKNDVIGAKLEPNSTSQQWKAYRLGDGKYFIKNEKSGKLIDIKKRCGGIWNVTTGITPYGTANQNQRFTIKSAETPVTQVAESVVLIKPNGTIVRLVTRCSPHKVLAIQRDHKIRVKKEADDHDDRFLIEAVDPVEKPPEVTTESALSADPVKKPSGVSTGSALSAGAADPVKKPSGVSTGWGLSAGAAGAVKKPPGASTGQASSTDPIKKPSGVSTGWGLSAGAAGAVKKPPGAPTGQASSANPVKKPSGVSTGSALSAGAANPVKKPSGVSAGWALSAGAAGAVKKPPGASTGQASSTDPVKKPSRKK